MPHNQDKGASVAKSKKRKKTNKPLGSALRSVTPNPIQDTLRAIKRIIGDEGAVSTIVLADPPPSPMAVMLLKDRINTCAHCGGAIKVLSAIDGQCEGMTWAIDRLIVGLHEACNATLDAEDGYRDLLVRMADGHAHGRYIGDADDLETRRSVVARILADSSLF
jgi:hypothetical protein